VRRELLLSALAVRVLSLGASVLGSGCSTPGGGEPCPTGFLGTPSGTPDLQILALRSDDTTVPVTDGGSITLMLPPQGGRVLFVGARATNVDGCGLQLTGALRDETTHQVRVDSRTVNLIPTGDGWGATGVGSVSESIANFSNITVCPNQWSMMDVFGHAYGLEVTVVDRGGRTATGHVQVTPYCGEPANAAECMCICAAGYVLGQACPSGSDGGAE
jgi:hypothetical protein